MFEESGTIITSEWHVLCMALQKKYNVLSFIMFDLIRITTAERKERKQWAINGFTFSSRGETKPDFKLYCLVVHWTLVLHLIFTCIG